MTTRTLSKNLVFLYAGEILARGTGMLVFAYLARKLGQSGYGAVECAVGTYFVANLALEAGLSDWGAREAARRPDETRRLAARVIFLRFVTLAFALAVVFCSAFLLRPEGPARTLTLFYALVLVPGPLVLNWIFQARDETHVIAGTSVLRQILLAAAVFLFARDVGSAIALPIGDAVGLCAVVVVHHVLFRKKVGSLDTTDLAAGSRALSSSGGFMALSAFTWALRLYAPLLLLGRFLPDGAEAGIFGAAHRLIVSAHTFVWLYFANLLPSLTRAVTSGDRAEFHRRIVRSLVFVMPISTIGAVIGLPLAEPVVTLINGAAFAASGPVLAWMLWMLVAAFFSGHFRYGLIAQGRVRAEFCANALGAAAAVTACFALRSNLGALTAAKIFVAAEVVTAVVAIGSFTRKIYR